MVWAEGDTEHEWNLAPGFKWSELPHEDAEFKLVELQDDPICNSAGCTQFLFPKGPDDPPRDYPVADFGIDHDILASQQNEENAKKFLSMTHVKKPEEETSLGSLDKKLKKEANVAITKVVDGEDNDSAAKNAQHELKVEEKKIATKKGVDAKKQLEGKGKGKKEKGEFEEDTKEEKAKKKEGDDGAEDDKADKKEDDAKKDEKKPAEAEAKEEKKSDDAKEEKKPKADAEKKPAAKEEGLSELSAVMIAK